MKYKVVISNTAKVDIINALRWYKENVPNKVKALNSAINKTAKSLAKDPERFQIQYNHHRFSQVAKFGFSIHYFVDKARETVVVTAMFHQKENPIKWEK